MASRLAARRWKLASLALLATGLGLLGYMVHAEGEPGALPLALVLLGALGYAVAAIKARAKPRG